MSHFFTFIDKHHDKAYGVDNQEHGHHVNSRGHHAHEEGHDDVRKAKEHYQKGVHDSAHQERLKQNAGGYVPAYGTMASHHSTAPKDHLSSSTDKVTALKTDNATSSRPSETERKRKVVRVRVRTKSTQDPPATVAHAPRAFVGLNGGQTGTYAQVPSVDTGDDKPVYYDKVYMSGVQEQPGENSPYFPVTNLGAYRNTTQDTGRLPPGVAAQGVEVANVPYSTEYYRPGVYKQNSNTGRQYDIGVNNAAAVTPGVGSGSREDLGTLKYNNLYNSQPNYPINMLTTRPHSNAQNAPESYNPRTYTGPVSNNARYGTGAYHQITPEIDVAKSNDQHGGLTYHLGQYQIAQGQPNTIPGQSVKSVGTAELTYDLNLQAPVQGTHSSIRHRNSHHSQHLPPTQYPRNSAYFPNQHSSSQEGPPYAANQVPVQQRYSQVPTPEQLIPHPPVSKPYSYSVADLNSAPNQQGIINQNDRVVSYPLPTDRAVAPADDYRTQFTKVAGPGVHYEGQDQPPIVYLDEAGSASPYVQYAYPRAEQKTAEATRANSRSEDRPPSLFQTFRNNQAETAHRVTTPMRLEKEAMVTETFPNDAVEEMDKDRRAKSTTNFGREGSNLRCVHGNCTSLQGNAQIMNQLTPSKHPPEFSNSLRKCRQGSCSSQNQRGANFKCDEKTDDSRCMEENGNRKNKHFEATNNENNQLQQGAQRRRTMPRKPKTLEEQALMSANADLELARPMLEGLGYIFDLEGSATESYGKSRQKTKTTPKRFFSQPVVMRSPGTMKENGLWQAKLDSS